MSTASSPLTQPPPSAFLPPKKDTVHANPASRSVHNVADDHLDEDEDRTLDDILDSFVVEDDNWSLSEDGGGTNDDDSKRVEDLLAKLREDPEVKLPSPPEKKPGHQVDGDEDEDQDADDSEGEVMSQEVENILSRAMDELKLNPNHDPQGEDTPESASDPIQKFDTDTVDQDIVPDSDLVLPTVPQDDDATTEDDDEEEDREYNLPDLPSTPHAKGDAGGDNTGLTLPTVPTALVDPAPSTADPFESSIAHRLAALKGPGHKPVTTDAFGLPSAPTFQPEDRSFSSSATAAGSRVGNRKAGYTDDDQKTWCIVCLEDATVRCLGCEGDVYCARCWREMHVGPAAGYDERGHAWEKFDSKRV